MSDTKHWIIKIVPVLAFATGIIMSSIAGIMTLSSVSKLVLFDSDPYSYVTREDCRFDYNPKSMDIAPSERIEKPYERTEAEIEICFNEKKADEKNRFQQKQKQNLVDGISTLIVGMMLILAFRKRKE